MLLLLLPDYLTNLHPYLGHLSLQCKLLIGHLCDRQSEVAHLRQWRTCGRCWLRDVRLKGPPQNPKALLTIALKLWRELRAHPRRRNAEEPAWEEVKWHAEHLALLTVGTGHDDGSCAPGQHF